ncbi:SLAM family member 6-like [Rhincodon typus]|uniref:SLAM family member 6-like n=1 Tax=Rhincodon typus TaxID=259920 RepID=UPI0009A3DD80|nr:SLAM family member 6-like [Rhincodon typus]
MICTFKVVMFEIYIMLFTNQILALSQQTEFLNATIGENVLFSTNLTITMVQSIQWKYNCEGNQINIAMSTFPEQNFTDVFQSYSNRAKVFSNGSFLLSNVQPNDTGCYTMILVNTAGKEVTIKKILSVFEAEQKELHKIKNRANTSESIDNTTWNVHGIAIGVSVLGICVICVVVIYFIKRKKQESMEAGVKSNENLNSNTPMVVYSTYVGTFANYGKSRQNTWDQT